MLAVGKGQGVLPCFVVWLAVVVAVCPFARHWPGILSGQFLSAHSVGTVEDIAMSEKTNVKPENSRSKIDKLFDNAPGKVRVKAADDGKVYAGVVSPSIVGKFLSASQDDAFTALLLAPAETLKKSSGTFDKNGNKVTVSQSVAS